MKKSKQKQLIVVSIVLLVIIISLSFYAIPNIFATGYQLTDSMVTTMDNVIGEKVDNFLWPAQLDKEEYDRRLLQLVNYVKPKPIEIASTTADGTPITITQQPDESKFPQYNKDTNVTLSGKIWPPANPYPNGDAILPFSRILAYYGNFYSKNMGILGEYEEDEVIRRLMAEKTKWEAADPNTPVIPAIEHIAMVAQGSAGEDGMYRAMMPVDHIEQAYQMAKKIDGIVIYDLQIGLSTIERELPKFKDFIVRPEVHIAIDPEFSMKGGEKPGTVIGTFNASDINYVINYMSEIVRENKLPPKVLIVHRFTQNMVTGYNQIKPTSEVQVVMVMDGWGPVANKIGTYEHFIEPEPVQFTGLKIFYKNDMKPPSTSLFTPREVLELNPKPIYIQYQ
ncbi:hypothetical protein H6775_01855 [Candidatus Nomurabacteria bacterium]|nr:hypothetical protein [Candidatus Nomurabacteria bacterium]